MLSVRGSWRSARGAGATPTRATLAAWRGFVGRANGGMVVHIGVVLIAVGLTAATAFGQRGTVVLAHGETGSFAGHTVEFVGTRVVRTPSHISQQALLRVDGGAIFAPAISQFGAGTQAVGTPAVDSSVTADVYLTINNTGAADDALIAARVDPSIAATAGLHETVAVDASGSTVAGSMAMASATTRTTSTGSSFFRKA